MSGWCHVLWSGEQRSVEMGFVRILVACVEYWRAAGAAEPAGLARTAFIVMGQGAGELPLPVGLADPCGKGGGGRASATFAIAMTNPVGWPCQRETASPAEAMPRKLRGCHIADGSVSVTDGRAGRLRAHR